MIVGSTKTLIISSLCLLLLLSFSFTFAYAQDELIREGQIVELDDGTPVRYFTEEQLRQMALLIARGNSCLEVVDFYRNAENLFEMRIASLQQGLELSAELLDSERIRVEELQDALDRSQRRNRFLFCDNSICTVFFGFSVGVTVGIISRVF